MALHTHAHFAKRYLWPLRRRVDMRFWWYDHSDPPGLLLHAHIDGELEAALLPLDELRRAVARIDAAREGE